MRLEIVGGPFMTSVVLDTTILAKLLIEPPRNLEPATYQRELETRKKIEAIMDAIEKCNIIVYFPRSGVVELASVLKRAGFDREEIYQIINAVYDNFNIFDEQIIYPKALEIAVEEAPSGFDTYFIALAQIMGSLLITDDKGMSLHARNLGQKTMLVRELTIKEIKDQLRC
jgi:predicted DNA-binding protein (UPF0278 family)